MTEEQLQRGIMIKDLIINRLRNIQTLKGVESSEFTIENINLKISVFNTHNPNERVYSLDFISKETVVKVIEMLKNDYDFRLTQLQKEFQAL